MTSAPKKIHKNKFLTPISFLFFMLHLGLPSYKFSWQSVTRDPHPVTGTGLQRQQNWQRPCKRRDLGPGTTLYSGQLVGWAGENRQSLGDKQACPIYPLSLEHREGRRLPARGRESANRH